MDKHEIVVGLMKKADKALTNDELRSLFETDQGQRIEESEMKGLLAKLVKEERVFTHKKAKPRKYELLKKEEPVPSGKTNGNGLGIDPSLAVDKGGEKPSDETGNVNTEDAPQSPPVDIPDWAKGHVTRFEQAVHLLRKKGKQEIATRDFGCDFQYDRDELIVLAATQAPAFEDRITAFDKALKAFGLYDAFYAADNLLFFTRYISRQGKADKVKGGKDALTGLTRLNIIGLVTEDEKQPGYIKGWTAALDPLVPTGRKKKREWRRNQLHIAPPPPAAPTTPQGAATGPQEVPPAGGKGPDEEDLLSDVRTRELSALQTKVTGLEAEKATLTQEKEALKQQLAAITSAHKTALDGKEAEVNALVARREELKGELSTNKNRLASAQWWLTATRWASVTALIIAVSGAFARYHLKERPLRAALRAARAANAVAVETEEMEETQTEESTETSTETEEGEQ